jgi:hypothetical protein
LKNGINWVGSSVSSSDIRINGLMIEEKHCCFKFSKLDNVLTLTAEADMYVNGEIVLEETRLHHGDRVIIGGSHYFHLHFPRDSKLRLSIKVNYVKIYNW